jgi:uncharacterized membrane protein YkvA (DUF1232 family)
MEYVVRVAVTLAVVWLAFVVALLLMRPKGLRWRDVLALMPDLARMLQSLARDAAIPWRVRARLWALLAFMASPIDLIPDVVPVVGVADDAVLVYVVVRSVVRACGRDVLERHWPGSSAGLRALESFLKLPDRSVP